MEERLLQFIWEFQYFNQGELATEEGERLQILCPGRPNHHQGPDFLDASIRIGHTLWAGAVEIHVRHSDWMRHNHHLDPNYQNVILHVVWEDDRPDAGQARTAIPILNLRHRTSKVLLHKYRDLMEMAAFIPCERQLGQAWETVRGDWLHILVEERLKRKSRYIWSCLESNRGHWEETAWRLIARNFGMPVNSDAFEAVARSIPYSLLCRLRGEPATLEALLFGQAGLLDNAKTKDMPGGYPDFLRREYDYLRVKFGLASVSLPVFLLRMRPAHFPAIRLSQLAALFCRQGAWCTVIREASRPRELDGLLAVHTSPYWESHYTIARASASRFKGLGSCMKNSLIINSFVPLLFAYGSLFDDPGTKEKALRWLDELPPETNAIVSKWRRIGIGARTAFESQALLELKAGYCGPKRCLKCAAGRSLLRRTL
jgi:hypothetical protein